MSSRFADLRRLYLYLVTLICLVALQLVFKNLSVQLAEYWARLDPDYLFPGARHLQRQLTDYTGVLLAVVACLTVHYALIQGWMRRELRERGSFLRSLYLFASVAAAFVFFVQLLSSLLSPALHSLTGVPGKGSGLFWIESLFMLPGLCLSGGILAHHSALIFREQGRRNKGPRFRAAEAIFLALLQVVGYLALASVLQDCLTGLAALMLLRGESMSLSMAPRGLAAPLATALTLILALHLLEGWRLRLRNGRIETWGEVLQSIALHAGLLYGLIVTLYAVMQLLVAAVDLTLLADRLSGPRLAASIALTLPVGIGFWLWFRFRLARTDESAAIGRWRHLPRHLYLYSAASVALGWTGHAAYVTLSQLLTQLGGETASGFAQTAAAEWPWVQLLVGAATLAVLWRDIRRAEDPDSARSDLRMFVRRFYLYVVTIVSTLALIAPVASLMQQLLDAVFGLRLAGAGGEAVAEDAVAAVPVLAAVLLLHVRLLRRQGAAAPSAAGSTEAAAELQSQLDSARREDMRLKARIEALEKRLAAATASENEGEGDP